MNVKKGMTICALAALALSAAAQNNIAEEVVWWIGDQPILKSEVEEMYQNMLYENPQLGGKPYCIVPENIAIEKLFLHQAELDSVEVQESMIQSEVERRINYMISNLGSQEKLEQFYRRTMPEIRETMRESVRNAYMVQEVQRSLTKNIKVTPSDVRKFFAQLPTDSIPFVPLQVETQIISLNPAVRIEEVDEVKARLRDFTDKINKGEVDFSTLAILYSEDPGSSVRGGELGFINKASLDPAYAAVAFNLNDPKKVSKIVESQFGFHIIQLIEKRGDRINTRHILLRPKVSDADLTDAIHHLDTVRSEILAENFTFEDVVPYVSSDKDTRNNKGIMINDNVSPPSSRFEMAQLPQEVSRAVDKLSVGEISEPFIMRDPKRNNDIVAMVKLSARIPGHKANLSDDYQLIKQLYEESERERIINDWVEKKIKDTYVRIEDGWRDCEFKHNGWIKQQ